MARRPVDPSRPVVRPDCSPKLLMSHMSQQGQLGEARLNTTPSATTHGPSPIVLSARHRRPRRLRWGCNRGTASHEAEQGRSSAGRRPNLGCGPRAAAEATRHNLTKPHRPRPYLDAGRERASGAAGRSTRQAGASTSRPLAVDSDGVAGLRWTGGGVESRSDHADVGRGGANRFLQ
jgi:hypothetical protein